MTLAFDTRPLRHARWALAAAAALLALALAPMPARAHAPSNATLSLAAEAGPGVQQRWDIALRDLDRVLPVDADDDGRITWAELRAAWPQIAALADDGLRLATERGACTAGALQAPRIDGHADGTYAVLERRWQCPGDAGAAGLRVDYRLFADADASHRGLLQWRAGPDAATVTALLAPSTGPVALAGLGPAGAVATTGAPTGDARPSTLPGFVAEGVHHILIGTDHILFLLALLLPAVVLPATHARWTQALAQVAKVVTAFTVAHSITLALAVLGIANPPSRIVESLIAVSVVLAAVDNLRRFLPGVRWQLAFVFGLVHGFGFAGALAELGLDQGALARMLVGFNLGVELGQLGIVAVVLPLAWWLRHTAFYRRAVLAGGSAAIAAVAALWFVERAFDVALLG
ncbi:MAG: HupE/UreJ family protein [Burkholderiaceae bacterium]